MRLLSNIIKSTRINVSQVDKYNIEIPVMPKNIDNTTESVKQKDNINEVNKIELNVNKSKEIIQQAKEEAQFIIQQAEEEAQFIIQQAKNDAEFKAQQILENAQNEGYNFGYNSAIEEVNMLKMQVQKELELAILEKEETLNSIEPEIINLTLKISKNIFGEMLKINPQIIILLIKKGLSQVNTSGKIFIHVSKDDYAIAQQNITELEDFIGSRVELEILRDLDLDKGDCIIETQFGNVDCSFEQQFESIKNELIYILENR